MSTLPQMGTRLPRWRCATAWCACVTATASTLKSCWKWGRWWRCASNSVQRPAVLNRAIAFRLEITSSDFPNHDRNHNTGRKRSGRYRAGEGDECRTSLGSPSLAARASHYFPPDCRLSTSMSPIQIGFSHFYNAHRSDALSCPRSGLLPGPWWLLRCSMPWRALIDISMVGQLGPEAISAVGTQSANSVSDDGDGDGDQHRGRVLWSPNFTGLSGTRTSAIRRNRPF